MHLGLKANSLTSTWRWIFHHYREKRQFRGVCVVCVVWCVCVCLSPTGSNITATPAWVYPCYGLWPMSSLLVDKGNSFITACRSMWHLPCFLSSQLCIHLCFCCPHLLLGLTHLSSSFAKQFYMQEFILNRGTGYCAEMQWLLNTN